MSLLAWKTDDLIFVPQTFDDDSHRHFVKLFVFICGDMNGVTPWLRALRVLLFHKENFCHRDYILQLRSTGTIVAYGHINAIRAPDNISFPRRYILFEKWSEKLTRYSNLLIVVGFNSESLYSCKHNGIVWLSSFSASRGQK